jgi:hypothetical protein
MECSSCRLIRRPEHLIGRHWYLPVNWRSFIRWSPDQWVSQCYAIECYRSFYCSLFCVLMTPMRQCPISLRSEHTVEPLYSLLMHKTIISIDVSLLDNYLVFIIYNPQLRDWNLQDISPSGVKRVLSEPSVSIIWILWYIRMILCLNFQ